MASYWVSNPKKFCDYCKCWFADDRATRERHEAGKRHKEAVEQKIADVQRSAVEKEKEKAEYNRAIIEIERAAKESAKRDILQNPEMATNYGIQLNEEQADQLRSYSDSLKAQPSEALEDIGEWKQTRTAEGRVYYWNATTKVTSWEKPDSMLRQEAEKKEKEVQSKRTAAQLLKDNAITFKEKKKPLGKVGGLFKKKDATKTEPYVKQEPVQGDMGSTPNNGAVQKKKPFVKTEDMSSDIPMAPTAADLAGPQMGEWETPVDLSDVDLQLPDVKPTVYDNCTFTDEQYEDNERFEFKTKQLDTPTETATAPIAFKKKKFDNVNARGKSSDS